MKILLCGEGPHDIGIPNAWSNKCKEYVELPGWLQPLVTAAVGGEPCFEVRRRVELQTLGKNPNKQKLPPGHGAKAFLAKRAAVMEGFDILVFMADADSSDIRDWRRIVQEIDEGFKLFQGATRCVACVPMSASESWLLADSTAWGHVTSCNPTLPAKPEEIWGARNDPQANHPHRYFARVCNIAGMNDDRDTRVQISAATNISIARAKCPQSMEPFLTALVA